MSPPTLEFPIRIEPAGILLSCRPGETLIQCAWRHGYYWPTICGGAAECGACRCKVTEGLAAAEPPGDAEQLLFERMPHLRSGPEDRLACRLTATGPLTVRKPGVRPR